jgi:hypothetical protein
MGTATAQPGYMYKEQICPAAISCQAITYRLTINDDTEILEKDQALLKSIHCPIS